MNQDFWRSNTGMGLEIGFMAPLSKGSHTWWVANVILAMLQGDHLGAIAFQELAACLWKGTLGRRVERILDD